MKKKSVKQEKKILVASFVLLATSVFLSGTVMAVQGAEVGGVTRFAPAGPAPSAEFDVRLTITGDVPLVAGLVETIPEGFSFVSSTYDHYEVSGQEVAFAVIDTTEITYRVQAPASGEGTFTGTWTDLLSEKKGSIADTIVIVGGGGAGAIGDDTTGTSTPTPAAPAVTKTSRIIPELNAGVEVAMVFEDSDVALIALTTDTDVSDAKVEVERVARSPGIPGPSGTAYAFLEIEVENTEGAQIEGRIEFKVLKSWIADNGIDETTITLCRYDEAEGWHVLATSKTGEDADFVYFEAVTPGFSLFAVTGERAAVETSSSTTTPTDTPETMQIPNPAATPLPVPTAPPLATTTPASEMPGFGTIVTAVSLLIACLFVVILKNKDEGGFGK